MPIRFHCVLLPGYSCINLQITEHSSRVGWQQTAQLGNKFICNNGLG